MLQPEFKEFARLARESTLVPVMKSVSADLLTPVSAFLAIAEKEPYAFLLESIERGEQIGRFTFLGSRPYMRVRSAQGKVEIERSASSTARSGGGAKRLRKISSSWASGCCENTVRQRIRACRRLRLGR